MTIDELLIDHQEFHSDLQMDSYITVRNGGTLYGCYKQALRELSTRRTALIQRRSNIARLKVEIRKLEISTGKEIDDELNAVDADEKRQFLPIAEDVLRDTEREAERFRMQAEALRAAMELQGVEFPLSAQARDKLDREMCEHNLKARCAVECYTAGGITGVTMELIQSLPSAIKARIGEWLRPDRRQELIDWFVTFDPPPILAGHIECYES